MDKTIILGITGGIAAYKSCELVREFVKNGADVHVILTEAGENFVTPLTLQTLSRNPVHVDMFDIIPPVPPLPATTTSAGREKGGELEPNHRTIAPSHHRTSHISLADRADVVLIAPACANTIAKVAHGICDDLLTTTICATKAPVIFAPSMNVNMWTNPITQGNIKHLKNLHYHFIDPEEGELACGYSGVGRMADIKTITEFVAKLVKKN